MLVGGCLGMSGRPPGGRPGGGGGAGLVSEIHNHYYIANV